MAEECAYYYFDGSDYCCLYLKEKEKKYTLDRDWVHKYCWGYNYSDCPYYKESEGGGSSSACFLTTACCKAMNLPDDCTELSTLRNFRDTYMLSFPAGQKDVEHYYSVAPRIVEAIEESKDAKHEWERIYLIIKECIDLINNKLYEAAYEKYRSMTSELEKTYL